MTPGRRLRAGRSGRRSCERRNGNGCDSSKPPSGAGGLARPYPWDRLLTRGCLALGLLVPVAAQAAPVEVGRVGLFQRRGDRLVDPAPEVLAKAPLELLLVEVAGEGGFLVEPLAQGRQVPGDVLEGAEVGEGEAPGPPGFELVDRAVPALDVDVGRRRAGDDDV